MKDNKQRLPVIVVGAAGRMGALIANLVRGNERLTLAGCVERCERHDVMSDLPCPVADNLAAVAVPGAVAIDFTAPEVSMNTASAAVKTGMAAVIGSTGFTPDQKKELENLACHAPLLWSANMSVGVNVLLRILPELAKALGNAYDMEMTEIHHRHKKDAPSGTALMLAEALAKARNWDLAAVRRSCRDGLTGERNDKEIGVMALRGGDVPGIHSTYFFGPGEIIEVKHTAESRENFANGAIRAAVWLAAQKPGRLYSMQDVIFEEK